MTVPPAWAAGLWEFRLPGQPGRRGRQTRLQAAPTPSSPSSACILRAQVYFQGSKGLLPHPRPTTGNSDLHKKPRPTTPQAPQGVREPHSECSRRAGGPGLRQRDGPPPPACSPAPASPGPRAGGLASAPLRRLFFARTGSLLLSSLSERARGCGPGHKGGLGRDLSAAE